MQTQQLKEDVGSLLDIGRAIMRIQATVLPETEVKIQFLDGGTWVGTVTISRPADDSFYYAKGIIFQNDRSISLEFIGDADGPVGLPIYAPNGRIWTDDEDSEGNDHTRAAFYADGCTWTRDNAPKVKPFHSSKGAKLAEKASEIEAGWVQMSAKVPTDKGLKWFTAKELLKAGPETEVWPRKMPLPKASKPAHTPKAEVKAARKGNVHKRNKATGEIVPV